MREDVVDDVPTLLGWPVGEARHLLGGGVGLKRSTKPGAAILADGVTTGGKAPRGPEAKSDTVAELR
jgi:hypothetical protein